MPTPEETIAENLVNSKKVTIGGHSAEQHTLAEQIAAAEYLANQATKANRSLPIRIGYIRKPGA